MSSKPSRRRQQAAGDIRETLRTLQTHLSQLNRQVGATVELKEMDLACLDLLDRHDALSPSALAKATGLHPATLTGVLDRLERAGWLSRDRDPADRRAVIVRPNRHRRAEMMRLYAGMAGALNRICSGYSDDELELVAGFLRQVSDAGRQAAAELGGQA